MLIQVRSIKDLEQRARRDPELRAKLQNDPIDTLSTIEEVAYRKDVWLYRWVVFVLGVVVLISLVGTFFLSNGETPDFIVAVGSAAIGALTGLFAPSPTPQNGNQ